MSGKTLIPFFVDKMQFFFMDPSLTVSEVSPNTICTLCGSTMMIMMMMMMMLNLMMMMMMMRMMMIQMMISFPILFFLYEDNT